MSDYIFQFAGDTAIVVDFGNRIDLRLNKKVLFLAEQLNAANLDGVIECVPAIRSLTVYYEPQALSWVNLRLRIVEILEKLQSPGQAGEAISTPIRPTKSWRLPVCYDSAFAIDLPYVAEVTGLSPSQVIEFHAGTTYHVYALGFLPGLAYLGDVPVEIALSRRATPRPMIPSGSVGIATQMTCIYPMKTPCGWHIVGRSPVQLWDLRRQGGALLRAGDQVSLVPVLVREYEFLHTEAENGRLEVALLASR